MKRLEELWRELEIESRQMNSTGILKRLIDKESQHTIFLGIQLPSMNRLFIFSAHKDCIPLKNNWHDFKGFNISIQSADSENESFEIVLNNTSPAHNEVFLAMAHDLYSVVNGQNESVEAAFDFFKRLQDWLNYFERERPEGLGDEEQRGLYGELYFLKNMLFSKSSDLLRDLECWTGPKNRQHDFQFGNAAVEVKTSAAKQHQRLYISGEQQLDESLLEHLFLYFLSLSVIEHHENTLPAIIQDIRDLLRGDALSHFEGSIFERGYIDTQEWRYKNVGYSIRESSVFKVTEGFPKLTGKNIPQGVGDLRYSISVEGCRKFSIPTSDLFEIICRFRI